jgi:hypothetical protein
VRTVAVETVAHQRELPGRTPVLQLTESEEASPMLAALVVIVAVVLVAGWEVFCLADLARADRVRFLPRWAWAVACLIQIPLGGVLYLLIGRVWARNATR